MCLVFMLLRMSTTKEDMQWSLSRPLKIDFLVTKTTVIDRKDNGTILNGEPLNEVRTNGEELL